jgi:hypothetical protein
LDDLHSLQMTCSSMRYIYGYPTID